MNERLCADCGRAFTIGRDQAARYAARGWAPPRRCPKCRTARRKPHVDPADPVDAPAEPAAAQATVKQPASGRAPAADPTDSAGLRTSSSSDVDYDLEDPPDVPPEAPGPATEPEVQGAFEVQCSACGKMTRVKFRPNGKRPVYCQDCFDLR